MSEPEVIEGFQYRESKSTGLHTGRRAWHVTCERCGVVVHVATTGPDQQADYHRRKECKAS